MLVKNMKTGFTFDLTKEAVKNLLASDREAIFVVLEKDFKDERGAEDKGEKTPETVKDIVNTPDEELAKMSFNSLKKFCIDHEINIQGAKSNADLISRIKGE